MADFLINGSRTPIDCVIFDKDGTLLDFNALWSQKIERWINALILAAENKGVAKSLRLRTALDRTLGYDRDSGQVVPDSPLAVASMPRLYAAAMTVLYQEGLSWHQAELISEKLWQETRVTIESEQVRPVGDVAGTMRALRDAGCLMAIITSDDRSSTAATLPILGIDHLIDTYVCGDDPIPVKPAPDGVWKIGRELNVSPGGMMLVGDTASDMITGRNAGVACCVGIAGGAGDASLLGELADVTLPSIEGILPWLG